MGHVKIVIGILIGVFVLILVVQNIDSLNTKVELKINPVVTEEIKASEVTVYQMVLIAFLAGVLGTGLHGIIERFRLKKQIKILTRELQDKDKELSSLRNLPLTYDSVAPRQGEGT
ncbi:MAG: LapA family protein [Desulfobacteraceae bacterium]|nr:MAG: LapA family protein [Desulfobacteraceae bacterium]